MKRYRIISFIVAAILFKILYDVLIYEYLPEKYIMGMSFGKIFNIDKMIIGYLVFLVIMLLSAFQIKQITSDFCHIAIELLFFLYYIPLNSSFYINDYNYVYLFFTSFYWVFIIFLFSKDFVWGENRKKTENIIKVDLMELLDSKAAYLVFLFVDMLCVWYAYSYNGLKLTLDIEHVYEVRAAYGGSSSIIESIIYNFGGTIVVGISLLYALKRKKIMLIVMGVLSELSIYSIAMEKGHLLSIVVILALFFLEKKKMIEKISALIPKCFCIAGIICFLEKLLINNTFIFIIFIRRLFYIPAWINGMYFDFFSKNKLLLFSQDVFLVERLGLQRYKDSVLELINSNYFYGNMPSPNTGMFAEAYMHLGAFGVIVFPIIMVLLFNALSESISIFDDLIGYYIFIELILSVTNIPMTSGVFCVTYLFVFPFVFFVKKIKVSR